MEVQSSLQDFKEPLLDSLNTFVFFTMAAIASIARISAKTFMARGPASARFLATIKYTPSHEYIKVCKLPLFNAAVK